MTTYDAAIVILLVLGMVRGAWRGFTWQAASLASLILGYTSARTLCDQVGPYLPGTPEAQRGLAMVVIYIAVSGGIFGLAWMVRGTLRKLKFDAYDRHLGMLLGGAEAAGVGMVATLFLVSLAPATRQPIFASPTGHFVGSMMNQLGPVLPAEVRKVLAPHWEGIADSLAAAAPQPVLSATNAPEAAKAPAPTTAQVVTAAALPAIEEATTLPPLAPAPTPGRDAADAGVRRTAGKEPAPSAKAALEGVLERSRQELDQAVAKTLDTDPNQKAQSLRDLARKKTQQVQNAARGTADRARQQVGQAQGQVAKGQQALEQAIADSLTKGQQRVEQAIGDSIDQQLRRLGGLQPAAPAAPRPGVK